MSVRLRLKRMGNRHRPFYRITAVDQRNKRDGRVIEELGHYNPLLKDEKKQVTVKADRCAYWLSVGAQPSGTVGSLLKRAGLNPAPGTKIEDQTLPEPKPTQAAAAPVGA